MFSRILLSSVNCVHCALLFPSVLPRKGDLPELVCTLRSQRAQPRRVVPQSSRPRSRVSWAAVVTVVQVGKLARVERLGEGPAPGRLLRDEPVHCSPSGLSTAGLAPGS